MCMLESETMEAYDVCSVLWAFLERSFSFWGVCHSNQSCRARSVLRNFSPSCDLVVVDIHDLSCAGDGKTLLFSMIGSCYADDSLTALWHRIGLSCLWKNQYQTCAESFLMFGGSVFSVASMHAYSDDLWCVQMMWEVVRFLWIRSSQIFRWITGSRYCLCCCALTCPFFGFQSLDFGINDWQKVLCLLSLCTFVLPLWIFFLIFLQ